MRVKNDHSSLSSITAVQNELFHLFHINVQMATTHFLDDKTATRESFLPDKSSF